MTTKNMNTPPGSTQENEIDLLRLVGELWDHRKFIISVTALFTLIAVTKEIAKPNTTSFVASFRKVAFAKIRLNIHKPQAIGIR